MTSPALYQALALQLRCHAINSLSDVTAAREHITAQIARVGKSVAANKAFVGASCKLIVLPEYILTGFPLRESFSEWREKACLEPVSPEMDALCRIASKNDVYLALNAYERDAHFRDIFFQGCFLISPQGRIVLHYRRMNSVFSPTPCDVWSKYLDIYGEDALFPVADTELGRMAFIASDEILFPEVARMALMKGAEIFLHPSSETHGPMASGKDLCKQARAVENLAYVISANTAGITGTDVAGESADGGSRIIDFRGRILAAAGSGESLNANAEISLTALREARRQAGMQNLVSRQKFQQYASFYARAESVRSNALAQNSGENADRSALVKLQTETIARLEQKGVLP
ncbi:MAG: nitrilase [Proteobacteria bacterium]|nr:nitrilase [Pseudomonadota bacterium]